MVFNRAFVVTVVFLTTLVNAATYTGRIQVVNSNGGSYGFLKNDASGFNGVSFTGDSLQVSLNVNSTGPLSIVATNPKFPPPHYLGAQSSSYNPNLASGSDVTVPLNNVGPSNPGAPPDASHSASTIWDFDVHTKKLTPQWINTDGNKPPTALAYDPKYNKIFLAGDIGAYNAISKDKPASPVSFFLVPN